MPSEKDGFFVIGHRKGALRLCPERAEERSEMAEEANENQAAGGEETDWQAKYEFDYQSECHCSKTAHALPNSRARFDYQSECHCSKTAR